MSDSDEAPVVEGHEELEYYDHLQDVGVLLDAADNLQWFRRVFVSTHDHFRPGEKEALNYMFEKIASGHGENLEDVTIYMRPGVSIDLYGWGRVLNANPGLKRLTMRTNAPPGARPGGQRLPYRLGNQLTNLILNRVGFDDRDMRSLVLTLPDAGSLVELRLTYNRITRAGLRLLAEVLPASGLKVVELSGNDDVGAGIAAFVEASARLPEGRSLRAYFERTRIDVEAAGQLGAALLEAKVSHLSLESATFEPGALVAMFAEMRPGPSMVELSCGGVTLTDEAFLAMSSALMRGCSFALLRFALPGTPDARGEGYAHFYDSIEVFPGVPRVMFDSVNEDVLIATQVVATRTTDEARFLAQANVMRLLERYLLMDTVQQAIVPLLGP